MPSFLLTWSDLWCLRKVRSLSFSGESRSVTEVSAGCVPESVSYINYHWEECVWGTLHRKGTHVLTQKPARGVLFLFAFALYSADFQWMQSQQQSTILKTHNEVSLLTLSMIITMGFFLNLQVKRRHTGVGGHEAWRLKICGFPYPLTNGKTIKSHWCYVSPIFCQLVVTLSLNQSSRFLQRGDVIPLRPDFKPWLKSILQELFKPAGAI